MSEKPAVVIDTQIFLRAAARRTSLAHRLVFDMRDSYELVTSPDTTAEVKDVLMRSELRAKFSALTDEIAHEVFAILDTARQVALDDVPSISRDPKDDIFLACVVRNRAQYLVTEDKDLLVLDPFENIRILTALDFFKLIQPTSGTPPSE